MRNGLKVALVSNEFPPFITGGIGTHCYDLACSLSAKGVETKVLSGAPTGEEKRVKISDLLEVISLPYSDIPPRYLWFQCQNLKKLYRLVSDCDVIHGVNPTASVGLALSNQIPDKSLITTHHSDELITLKMFAQMPLSELSLGDFSTDVLSYPLDTLMKRLWFKRADRIIVPGYSTYAFMKRTFPESITKKISIVYNGINFDKMEALTKYSQDSAESEMSIVCFSRLVALKGVARFLKSSESLFSDFPQVQLRIFGRGPLYQTLQEIVRNRNMSKNVSLVNNISYGDLMKQMSKAAVVAFPTLLEIGPSISALESMACKRPVVAFDFPFNREFIGHMETGLLARPWDFGDLISKIKLLLENKPLRLKLAENAQNFVKKNHDWSNLVDKYISIYNETLHR
ncbi:glycosyltransferase family 4 protein [Candidatus Bathyarchaeota archaeon]|nr:glycosyltransferase family 4 protein [Candidatus Bathyarchaeota archaeon]